MQWLRLKNAKLSKRYLYAFFFVVVIVDLAIASLLFALYSGMQISTVAKYSVAQLEQVCTSTDILYESLEAVANQIVSDTDTVSFLLSSETNRLQEAKAGSKIRAIRTANPYFRYITIYNDTSRRFVSSACAGSAEELDIDSFYDMLGDQPYVCYLRNTGASYNTQPHKTVTVYTFIFPIRLKVNGTTDLVIIDVNDSYFNQALSNIRLPNTDQQILLAGADGQVIVELSSNSEQEYFSIVSDPISSQTETLMQEVFASPKSSDSLSRWDNQGKLRFITYAKASNTGWTILNILPYGTILSGIGTLTALTLTLILVTLAFGYIISRKASSHLYAPIRTLYENYVGGDTQNKKGNELELLSQAFSDMYSKADRLEQGLIGSYKDAKNIYLSYLLSGEEKRVQASLPTYKRLEINLESPFYCPILLECIPQISEHLPRSEQQDPNLFICFYALENITRELISAFCKMEFLRTDENRFTVLLYLEKNSLPQPLHDSLTQISSFMSREFQLDTTICVGNVADSWNNINLSYEQALISLNTKSSSHYGQVFLAGESTESLSSEVYYSGLHTKLADYIRDEDLDACATEFDLALSAMQNINFRTVTTFFRHTLMSVLDDFSVSFERDDSQFALLMKQLDKVDNSQNVQALRASVMAFLSDLNHLLALNRRNTNLDAALKVRDYIDANYSNPDLSLRMLADMVNLSPAYLGKVFTTATTFSFNDYLTNVRTTQAAQLLRTTKLPISRISEEVGILNTNYFYSVFKKRFGTTPSAYRKENKLSDKEKHPTE